MQLCKGSCIVFLHSLLKSITLQGTFGVLPSLQEPLFLLISVGSSPLLLGLPCTRLLACGIFDNHLCSCVQFALVIEKVPSAEDR